MRNVFIRVLLPVAIASLLLVTPNGARAADERDLACEFETEGRVVVVGDLFSEYNEFFRILRLRELIDEDADWIGGDAHLVQTGNIFPRDNDWRRINNLEAEHEDILKLLMKLEVQAEEAGGRVHALHGMEDVMVLRWRMETQPREVQALWAGPDAQAKRDALEERWLVDHNRIIQQIAEHKHERLIQQFHDYMNAFYRPGSVEFLERYGSYDAESHTIRYDTEIGAWMRSRNAIIKINNVLYGHAGLSPQFLGLSDDPGAKADVGVVSLREVNDLVRARNDDPGLLVPINIDTNGPVWWRGLDDMGSGGLREYALEVLPLFGADAIVVGNNAARNIRQDQNVFLVDSGVGSPTRSAPVSVLEIDGDQWKIYINQRAVEQGVIAPLVHEGGPDNPVIPGGEVPKLEDQNSRD